MTTARAKGLAFVREVKKILEDLGEKVEGPFYKPMFFGGKTHAVHKDLFGVFDLLSYAPDTQTYCGHQVSVLGKKAEKVAEILGAGMQGIVWCRTLSGKKIVYRRWQVEKSEVFEIEGVGRA